MKHLLRLIVIVALAALGTWLWIRLHPGPEKIIRKNLLELARTASFAGPEGNLARLAAAQKIADLFATDAELVLDLPNVRALSIEGRDEIFRVTTAVRSRISRLKVEFLDLIVTLGPDTKTAQVELTAKVFVPEEKDFIPLELKFSLGETDSKWLITRVETVKVLK